MFIRKVRRQERRIFSLILGVRGVTSQSTAYFIENVSWMIFQAGEDQDSQ